MAPRHPLQRLEAPSKTLSMVIHVLGIASFIMSFRFLSQLMMPISSGFGGNYQHLTNIGLALSFVTFVVALAADLTLNPALFRLKNFLSVTSAPLEVLISILYWGIRSIDKALLFPDEFDLHWVPDVGFHLAPAVFLSIDLLLFSPPYTIRAYGAMAVSMTIAFCYWGWVELCFSYNGWYPYPIFDILNKPQRVVLFTFSAALMTASTVLLKWVYGRVNGYEKIESEAHKPLKKVQ